MRSDGGKDLGWNANEQQMFSKTMKSVSNILKVSAILLRTIGARDNDRKRKGSKRYNL